MNPRESAGFEERFGAAPSSMYFSPGRINLIGEHTDYNDGLVMPVAVHLGTLFSVGRNPDGVLRLFSALMDDSVEIFLEDTAALQPTGRWADYFAGVVREFLALPCEPLGLDILVDSTLPIGSGLSSSASIGTGLAAILNDEWKAGRSRIDLARIAQRSENDFVGLACGILDQFAVAMSEDAHAILLDCGTFEWQMLPFPSERFALLAVETSVPRRLVESGYNQRRAECERALTLVRSERPAVSLSELSIADVQASVRLREDPIAFKRARHVVSENARVVAAANALRDGDLKSLGAAMYASHQSLSEDYEVSCPELDVMVDLARQQPGVVGAKMTGAGFGGSVVVLVEQSAIDDVSASLPKVYAKATNLEPIVTVCRLSAGVQRIT